MADSFIEDSFTEDKKPSQTSDFFSHAGHQITGGIGALFHPIDTLSSMLDDAKSELAQARENLDAGKHADAAYHLGNAVPVIGPLIRSMSEEGSQGQYGAALGDLAGFVALGKMAESAPRVIPKATAKVVEIAKKPAGAAAAGAVVGHMTGIPGGGVVGAVIGRELAKDAAESAKAPSAPETPAIYDQIAKGMGGKKYDNLDPTSQAAIRKIADNIAAEPAPPTLTTATPPAPVTQGPEPPPLLRASMTDAQLEQLHRSNVEAINQRMAKQPAQVPSLPVTINPEVKTIPFEPNRESNVQAKGARLEAKGRFEKVNRIADRLFETAQQSGDPSAFVEDLGRLKDPSHWKPIFEVLGEDLNVKNPATVNQVMDRMRTLLERQSASPELMERLRKTGGLAAAQELANEMH